MSVTAQEIVRYLDHGKGRPEIINNEVTIHHPDGYSVCARLQESRWVIDTGGTWELDLPQPSGPTAKEVGDALERAYKVLDAELRKPK